MFARTLKCPMCDEPVSPTQTTCSCGALLARRSAMLEHVSQINLRPALSWVCAPAVVVLLWWAVAPVPLHGFGLGRLYMLVAVTSAMLAMLIAHQVAEVETRSPLDDYIVADFTPVKWFFAVLVLWPVTYPLFVWHFFHENDRPLQKRSWVLAAIFLVLLLLVALRGKPAPAVQAEPPATDDTPAEVQLTPVPGAPPAAVAPISAPPPALTPTPVPPTPTPAPVGMTMTVTPAPTPVRFRVVGQTPVFTPRTQQPPSGPGNSRASGGGNQTRTGASLMPPGRE